MGDLQRIRTELDANPGVYGALNDQEAAARMMVADVTVWQAISGAQIYEAIDRAEFTALAAGAVKDAVAELVTIQGEVDVSPGSRARAVLETAFNAQSATRANLAAIAGAQVTRMQVAGLRNTRRVRATDIAKARALP